MATAEQSRQRNDRHSISWRRYVATSLTVGVAFVLLDMVANANPLAEQAYAVFAPIIRPGIDIVPAIAIDLAYGFALSAIFLVLYQSLPGKGPFSKGLSFGLLVWFLRVVMSAAGQWVLFAIPLTTVTYTLVSGLLEMLVLGALLGSVTRGVNEHIRQMAASLTSRTDAASPGCSVRTLTTASTASSRERPLRLAGPIEVSRAQAR